jgi:micrococcal nuclease
MTRKKIARVVTGAVLLVGAALSGGVDPSDTTAVEPSTAPASNPSGAPSTDPSASPSPSVAPTSAGLSGVVTEVVDGDTIRVELPAGIETVRIIGIDTPEVVHPTQPEACYGAEATAFATTTLDGQTVTLEVDRTQDEWDKFDRLLAHVYVGDDLYTAAAIAGGFGIHYIYEVPSIHAAELDAAAAEARAEGRGIWASCEGRVDLPKVAPIPVVGPEATQAPKTEPAATPEAGCHPSYEPCVPDVGRDLDCSDIGFEVAVIGPDEYRLDGEDNDGRGCESY